VPIVPLIFVRHPLFLSKNDNWNLGAHVSILFCLSHCRIFSLSSDTVSIAFVRILLAVTACLTTNWVEEARKAKERVSKQ
jgi:hypothetical protein